ncbi:MAG: protein kinase, partial [Chloroflexi bacterium]|nr:protein kinase [Chloroflexota bacterium]
MARMQNAGFSGRQIGRFQIEGEIGRGAMGVVYRAFDPQRQQTVALKLLAPHLAHDEKALARFQREASSVANLQHPHIAVFYELGAHEERPF